MFFKKCILMVLLAITTVFFIPNFASAESNTDVSKGKVNGAEFSSSTARYDLGGSYSIDSLYIFVKNTSASGGSLNVRLYNSKNQQVWSAFGYDIRYLGSSHKGDEYKPSVKKDDVRYIEFSTNGSGRIVTFRALGTEYIPEISNFKAIADYKKVTLNWENPVNSNNTKLTKLYQDGKEIKTFNLNENITSYVVENLTEGKNYSFKMTVVDDKGRETGGITKSVKTLIPLIDPPENVFITPQNKKLVIAWNGVNSPYLKGYNIYIDGKKVNSSTLNSNKLIVDNLENDKSYKIQISAVNIGDAEGKKSGEFTESPSKDATTIEYDLKPPLTAMELLETAGTIVLWLSPFILVGIVIIWFKPLKELIVKAVLDHKKKSDKK
ncbi:fibronectin type III domain-containing protein [Bacillus toyonensis]|uniref:fibronectin type III domain-containing protein n=1 Tax=Bacillus toyonensis TaxID=155322 RepID=UPI0021CE0C8F|nr:fibronectin type III domain-containing protein [Bacillus toyonensis]